MTKFYIPVVKFDKHDSSKYQTSICLTEKQKTVAEKVLKSIANIRYGFTFHFVEIEHEKDEE